MEIMVKVNTVMDVKNIVNAAMKMPFDIKAGKGKYIVDAKSIMGVLSLDLSNSVRLSWENSEATEEKTNAFLEAVKEYRT